MPATTPCRPWSAIWFEIPRFRSRANLSWNESAALKRRVLIWVPGLRLASQGICWEQESKFSVITHSSTLKTRVPRPLRTRQVYKFWNVGPNQCLLVGPNGGMGPPPEVFQHDP